MAIFPNQGPFPSMLQETTANIPGISFTKYNGTSENVYSEIWLPIKKKAN